MGPSATAPSELMAMGPFHRPAPEAQETWTAPLGATLNTSVWLATPYCWDAARLAPGATAPGELMAIGPFHRPAPQAQETWTAPLGATLNTSVWLATPYCWDAARLAPGVVALGATGVTGMDGVDGGPVPTALVAVTAKG